MKPYRNLAEILTDQKLAALGDAYVNFVYSLALSNRERQPAGAKVKGSALAEALRRAGLRSFMPSRITSHMLADAAEALIVYAWLHNLVTLEESVETLLKKETLSEGLSKLITTIVNKIKFS